jgi:hypothetical protein
MKIYEYVEIYGDPTVSIEQLNAYGAEGWQVAFAKNDGYTVVLQREKQYKLREIK